MTEVLAWTEERIARLRTLVGKGHSAAAIAEMLGGVSRNAVIGKTHRLGLTLELPKGGAGAAIAIRQAAGESPSRARAPRHKRAVVVRAAPRPAPPPMPPVAPTEKGWPKVAGPAAVRMEQLKARHCRMPLWSGLQRDGLYCGEPVAREGSSWCAACAALVFEPRRSRAA